MFKLIREIHRNIYHITDIILPRYPNTIEMRDNSDLRVKFLMKEITEDEWVKQLKLRQKKSEKSRAVNLILSMLVETLTDIFIAYNRNKVDKLDVQFENLRNYANREFSEISRLFKNKALRISKTWVIG